MNPVVKINIAVLLAALLIAGCSSNSPPQEDPYNQADTQRSNAKQAQDELSSEIDKKK